MTKTYLIRNHAKPCTVNRFGFHNANAPLVKVRVGIKNDTYESRCECGSVALRLGYAKRSK